jgi:hypothetical protein
MKSHDIEGVSIMPQSRELDANMPVHPDSAAIEAGAKVLRRFRDTHIDLYTDKEIVWLVYCTMRAEDPVKSGESA